MREAYRAGWGTDGMPDFTARITEILGAHQIRRDPFEQGSDCWYCTACRQSGGWFRHMHAGLEHQAELIAAVAEEHSGTEVEALRNALCDVAIDQYLREKGLRP